jgi:hypothetical protein
MVRLNFPDSVIIYQFSTNYLQFLYPFSAYSLPTLPRLIMRYFVELFILFITHFLCLCVSYFPFALSRCLCAFPLHRVLSLGVLAALFLLSLPAVACDSLR